MAPPRSFPTLSAADSVAFVGGVAVPTWAKGIIIRRKAATALAERLDTDARAVRRMQRLRAKYGEGPLLLRNPVRPQAILLRVEDVRRVLDGAPEPFTPASSEKRAALSHFEPHNSLITRGPERGPRRAFHDAALESGCPVHSMADRWVPIVEAETDAILAGAGSLGELDWRVFFEGWMRIVRRIVLGAEAADDRELTDRIARLRGRANWAFAAPKNRALRAAFHDRLGAHLARAEPDSLAARVARMPGAAAAEPTQQMAQWFFAFDPAGMATFRALALLLAHPQALARACAEAASDAPRADLPFLRAALVEALRLYPTTPMVLRQTTRETEWAEGTLPAGTGILIFAPFFHRDDQRLPNAHRFAPEDRLGEDPAQAPPFLPFSAGPAACPARHLVPMLASMVLARILRSGRRIVLRDPQRLDGGKPLPGTLDPFTLRFALPAGG